jgi:hypothetical protein
VHATVSRLFQQNFPENISFRQRFLRKHVQEVSKISRHQNIFIKMVPLFQMLLSSFTVLDSEKEKVFMYCAIVKSREER